MEEGTAEGQYANEMREEGEGGGRSRMGKKGRVGRTQERGLGYQSVVLHETTPTKENLPTSWDMGNYCEMET